MSFDGEVLSPDILRDESRHSELDLKAFWERNSKPIRTPEITTCAQDLRAKHKHFGVIGFCFGGWAVFRLGSKSHSPPLVDCISTAHPSVLEEKEMQNVAVPVQIIAAEHDLMFPPEMREVANRILPSLGVPYEYQYFPGAKHGFATRGNAGDERELKAMVRAKDCAVVWFQRWLAGGLISSVR
jgi:dienelactone hydrolase